MARSGERRLQGRWLVWWENFSTHPVNIVVSFVAALAGIVGVVYGMYGPFNLLPRTEPPLTTEEWAYLRAADAGVKDAGELLKLVSEPPHLRDKFDSPDYTTLNRRVAEELQALRETDPSERLRPVHLNVVQLLENTQDADRLMSQYSYSLDHETFVRASGSVEEGLRAMSRATAELGRVMKKQQKVAANENEK